MRILSCYFYILQNVSHISYQFCFYIMVPREMRERVTAGKDKREEGNHKTENVTKCRERRCVTLCFCKCLGI
uniref:Uncharacterized protein n=1 Tax=Anguilla anguilla TaxID=7936 RepID=A0A0E9VBK5_ANGAN